MYRFIKERERGRKKLSFLALYFSLFAVVLFIYYYYIISIKLKMCFMLASHLYFNGRIMQSLGH